MKLRLVGFPVLAGTGKRRHREQRDDTEPSESTGQTHASNTHRRNGNATVESQPPTATFQRPSAAWLEVGSWSLGVSEEEDMRRLHIIAICIGFFLCAVGGGGAGPARAAPHAR